MANDKRFNAKNGLSVGATPVNVVDANGSITANTLTVGGASINTTSYSGTANNASNLNGQPASFYTNASNITTGTLPYAQIPANIVNTTAAFTYSGVQTYNANVVIGSTGEIVINSAAGISANGTFGSAGQMLTSNGTAVYWSTPQIGDITAVTAGSGLTGGGTSGDLTINIGAGTGITVNADDIAVNAAYIATISANNASYLGTYIASDYPRKAEAAAITGAWDFSSGSIVWSGHSFTNTYDGSNVYQHIGTATSTDKIWNLRVYKADNNYTTFVFNSAGVATAENSYRAPIFYDIDNTSYYFNGAGTSSLTSATFAGSVSGITTLAAGNTTITGFANVSTTLQVGANTTVGGDVIVSSTYPRIWLNDTNNNSDFSIINNDGNLSVYDDTNGAHRLWVASGGSVGIGTSSPGAKLDVSSSTNNIVASRSTSGYAAFQRFAPTGQQVYDFYTINSVEAGRITVDGGNFMAFSTGSSATERMRIGSSGSVTAYVDVRSPIFYDNDNTSYYIDPFSVSNVYRINSDGMSGNQFLTGTTNYTDVVNGSTWYGIGRADSDLLGGGGNTVQVAGYYGLRMRTSSATLDVYPTYTQASGSMRAPLFYDSNDTTYYLDPAGDSVINNTYVNRYFQRNSGVPTNNLGTPTVTEMALFQEQFDNKTAFYPIANIKFYTSTDGNTWTEYTGFSDTEKRKFVGGNATSGINIPNGTPYFRIEILNNGAYVFLDALYMYWSGNSHSTTVKIRALRADNTWFQWTDSSTSISSWPGHMYLPFSSIPFIDIPGSTGHYKTVHIDFQPTWSTGIYASNVINLFNMQVWGGYPASKRTIFSVDELKNTTFPGDVRATLFYDTDNTGYYLNPNSSSNIYSINVASQLVVVGDARAPIYYDSNDTSRYVDPNDVTIINDISARRIGINNTTGNNGYGISLYNGYTGGEPTYGMMFQQTGTFGTYGQVSGDWATYFNMNDNNARGWIFRKATVGNIASISAGGEATFGTSVRTPIYYDSNNTSYYMDPATATILSGWAKIDLAVGAGPLEDGRGFVINGSYTNGQYSTRFRKWDDGGGLPLYIQQTTGTANVWSNVASFGSSNSRYLFHVDGIAYSSSDFRAPVFYDSDNTAFFLDPNSTSVLSTVRASTIQHSSGNTGIELNNGTYLMLSDPGATRKLYIGGSGDPSNYFDNTTQYFRTSGGGATYFTLNSSYGLHTSSLRAPIFYDSNDTTYYLDPASSTALYTDGVIVAGQQGFQSRFYSAGRNRIWSFYNADAYGLSYFQGGPDYIGLHPSGTATQAGSDFWVSSAGTAQARVDMRAPIFYDSNNTAFYFDGASTTNINTLSGNGKEVLVTNDSYLRINQSSAFSSGTWFGGTLVRVDGFYAGSNGGTTTSRVAILSGSYSGSNVITLDGSTGLITSSGTGLNGGLRLTNPTGARDFRVIQKDGGYFVITDETAGAERLTINSSGLVQAVGDLSAGGSVFVGSGNASYIYMNDADNGQRVIHNNSDRIGFLTQAGGWGSWCEDSGQWTSEHSLRAPILYDHNDTGYYLDINGSNVSNINTIIAGLAYFRSNPGSGVYSGAVSSPPLQVYSTDGGAAFMSFHRSGAYAVNFGLDPDNYLRIGGWSAGAGRWVLDMSGNNWAVGSFRAPIFYDSDNTGYYIDASSTSRLSALLIGGSEALIYESATNAIGFRTGATGAFRYAGLGTDGRFTINNGGLTATGDVRGTIFYDQDNTGYYVDPASTSILYNMNLINLRCRFDRSWENYPGIAVLNTTDQGPQGEFRIHGLAGDNGGDYAVTLRVDGAGVFLGDFYAPIYYDYNNSAYYLNPNSDSVLYRTSTYLAGKYVTTDWADGFRNTPTQSYNFHGDVSSGGPAGTWWFYESMRHSNGANYWGTQIAWGWEDNANRLLQRNVTANSFSGWVEYLNTSDRTYNGNLYMTGSIRSTASDMRAPIFYDQDNTGYYLNPAATSYINALNIGPTASGSSYLNINGYNAYGGTGFHGFLTIYNTYSSATNPQQYWRLNGAGGFEIVNSPYNAVLFTFTQGGDFTAAGNVTAYSDKRLKDNIAPINNALDKVLQLNGVTFTRIDKEDTTQRYAGLLAQDVEVVLPEAVQVNETMSYGEIMSVDYNATIALLVEAIKEQQLTIASQSAKINTLEAKLDQIIQKLEG